MNLVTGIPTKLDVDKLMEAIKSLHEGDLFSYETIRATIGIQRNTKRFQSVIGAFRNRLMRERNIYLVCEPREGYRLADPDRRVTVAANKVSYGKRMIFRASSLAMSTDANRLSGDNRKLHDHLVTLPARLRLAELTAPKELA
jgi:hypothetical protein